MMSHELRTPLNVILGFTEGMAQGRHGPLSERQQDALGKMLQSGRHLLALLSGAGQLSGPDRAQPGWER